jgi:hypothetical protein
MHWIKHRKECIASRGKDQRLQSIQFHARATSSDLVSGAGSLDMLIKGVVAAAAAAASSSSEEERDWQSNLMKHQGENQDAVLCATFWNSGTAAAFVSFDILQQVCTVDAYWIGRIDR